MRYGKLAEKKFKATMNSYKEKGYRFWHQRQPDLVSVNVDYAGDYLISINGLLHSVEVKQISMNLGRDRFAFKHLEKRNQLTRLINFEDSCDNHKSWILLLWWNGFMVQSKIFLIPAKFFRSFIDLFPRKSIRYDEAIDEFNDYKREIFNANFIDLEPIFG